ncbi:hypothetical protein GGC63_001865 [Paenibacillus sp. OAS669]|nr:hypothetical protein [Paenibacillus sp. OAS669]
MIEFFTQILVNFACASRVLYFPAYNIIFFRQKRAICAVAQLRVPYYKAETVYRGRWDKFSM